ncbi:hypothetical protein A2230_08450 [candidate division WOR-1 bacterium RIFOXYA2_FULL_36_21]|uniref:Soluble ligand binding domain-containing protein n=1 Tax=candidate division WOR-1 bacterium RIFOXYB2_FULL_36_35 TaxID=1802578 RepID=A0A1F4S8D0_UNCSA|nr:MAG: hypothetical protein A2230_08450 [candidate division WOR-1 bacterium RIFOXYA2_FULL_36_21]OGC15338.1 MAG: hypothetical protein A2282_06200 [candidate division WOR-1 bacterium RIFOXYA12_FULL_36_13]OGC16680.1 MAG: hypothetical protein A2290_03665 [candidate division WOR-1 bacterium RIFOXYB2_FULL_36_35]
MKKIFKIIPLFLLFSIFGAITLVYAVDINSLGLTVPAIQEVPASEHSAPKSFGDMAMEGPIDAKSYILGPGDNISVHIIVGDEELSINHNLFVGADGNVFFPNIGAIYLSGLSLSQAKNKINSTIKNMYQEKFEIFVLLTQPKKVKIYLIGMVKNPGPLAIYDGLRVSEVIAQAGGIASGGSNRYIYIKRRSFDGSESKVIKADLFDAYRGKDLSKDIYVRSGDIIEVPSVDNIRISQTKIDESKDKLIFEGKEVFVYVYGEVSRSGRFEYVPGKSVSDYISYAGGPKDKALLNSVQLTRKISDRSEKYSVSVGDVIYNGDTQKDMEVLGGDVINVPGNFFYFSDFASFANTILLTLTLYSSLVK